MLRRTFLLGTAGLTGACSRFRNRTASLGSLAYIDKKTLWLRDLPDGTPGVLANGHRLSAPQFSRDGQWISFCDDDAGWMVTRDGKIRKARKLGSRIAGPGNQYAWISNSPDGHYSDGVEKSKATLLLSSFERPDKPKPLDESEGFFDVAGFTRNGDWLLYWKATEMGADIQTDGLDLYAVSTSAGRPRDLGVETLVHPDMISISPTRDVIAATSGGGRETWANKAIAIIDLAARGKPVVRNLTGPDVSAQLPLWSPDGEKLAWCAGPDAEKRYKQQLLTRGDKTITTVDPRTGAPKEIPITPDLALGASPNVIVECLALRRIWVAEMRAGVHSRQLTNDERYYDEEPRWSRDGAHILFGRIAAAETDTPSRTIWLMRSDGSELRQVAGPLAWPPDLSEEEKLSYAAYYGYTDWRSLFDWWRGP